MISFLCFVNIRFNLVEAGDGIQSGQLSFTYVTDQACYRHAECVSSCQNLAERRGAIIGAKCVKFDGNFYHYCCCYGSLTNACCQNARSGLDCHVAGPEVLASRFS